ncbi:Mannose or cellobiose epimerase, N-acyl-D-glucosamine 2-epimerase family [Roseateles sp. YR242]|uniref:AGE family epimerase/isomerase n=1 Tax=Roseateles sp. YR242 TaxID=1855305 RepID=UPI0008BF173C|nr:AGE family epimerase/isomerase [Roseateles sp. YR242]SEL82679.1 Mannose or cellobiose epimerase, N-acyl-D-glucosamine 2-epimerase family [Roseateles sp. YR242]
MSNLPDFRSPDVLLAHARHTMRFYHPRCIDPSGGFFHFFKDDGTVYDAHQRHLVSSTRFVFTYAMAYRRFGDPAYLEGARHGVRFLREAHLDQARGGYTWLLDWQHGQAKVIDGTRHAYGMAFVLLAYAHAAMAGVEEARPWIAETFDLMERRFWSESAGLYADEASADWQVLSPYRGQNANMHSCEALLAAFNATGERRYLARAALIAENITRRQGERCGGLIWEHYDAHWQPDWMFNKHDPANLFRPWGYQPGHFTEWTKLLLQLEAHGSRLDQDLSWILPTATQLFRVAVRRGWDAEHGGLCYSLAPDLTVCDPDKYFWVQAESTAAAALLAQRTGDDVYWDWYQRLWAYSWTHFVDHEHGAWYRILDRENRKLSDEKSPAGKVDYHTMGACYDIVSVLEGPR